MGESILTRKGGVSGTPQTIFAASDGSKWARTNAVNLTNVSNNVTSDFNYWQPANNSTSDPILNIGTVGANISGNIRLVPVNQVNIAQYSNIVINDTTGAKYVGYNGYDFNTNPTPTGNATFNRWLLNNSATGTVIFANATIVSGGTYNGPNTSINIANIPLINNTASYGGLPDSVVVNNNFIYVGGDIVFNIKKYHESNLVFNSQSGSYGNIIFNLALNNGFVYACGFQQQNVKKYHEGNLAFSTSSGSYGASVRGMAINNSFLYAVGGYSGANQRIIKYHESNLAFVASAAQDADALRTVATNNNFIYTGGWGGQIRKYHEGNLAYVGASSSFPAAIMAIRIDNGFIYITGQGQGLIQKYHEANLVLSVNSPVNYGANAFALELADDYVFVGGGGSSAIKKYHKSNLVFVGQSVNFGTQIMGFDSNNGFIYAPTYIANTVGKFAQQGFILDNQTFYTATKIKE
jgi:hypothetical protein